MSDLINTVKVRITGMMPLLLHNSQLADPLNPITQAIKKLTSKRKKTEDDHLEISRLEWHGGLYLDAKRRVCIPGANIEAMMVRAGRTRKLGKKVQAAVRSLEDWPLLYDGPKDPDKLWEHGGYMLRKIAKTQGSAVLRTRPQFFPWSLEFRLDFMVDQMDREEIDDLLDIAGVVIGLGDWKPRYGLFSVDEVADA